MQVLNEPETRALIGPAAAREECRRAFARLGRNEVELPEVLSMTVREHRGEVHAKGAYLHGAPFFSIKVATGFYANAERGLPVGSGAVWVFEASTGHLVMMILDDGYLTELRTGAAGAVAADLLAPRMVRTVGIIGAGSQARYQLEALLEVREPTEILVWSRHPGRAAEYAQAMYHKHGRPVRVTATPEALVSRSELVITATPSTIPIVRSEWVRPGTHITAVGSDTPTKHELDPRLLARATVVVDRLTQCLTQGELHHAVQAGVMTAAQVHAELGEITAGVKPGRRSDDEITVADLTGVGALDAAVANYVASRAQEQQVGRWLQL